MAVMTGFTGSWSILLALGWKKTHLEWRRQQMVRSWERLQAGTRTVLNRYKVIFLALGAGNYYIGVHFGLSQYDKDTDTTVYFRESEIQIGS